MTKAVHRKKKHSDLPPPLVHIGTITRVLQRAAIGPKPEAHLAVAVIAQAIADSRNESPAIRHSARAFLLGNGLDAWAGSVDINPRFIRELAIRTNYLPLPPDTAATAKQATQRRNRAGLQFGRVFD